MNRDFILILDFGGNQAYYTARRLRGEQFYCEILPGSTGAEEIIARAPKGVMLIGDIGNALNADPLPYNPAALGVPVLAMGGASRMLAASVGAEHLGIQLENSKDTLQFLSCELFSEMSHSDRYFERIDGFALPEGFEPVAATASGLMPAFANLERKLYGLQFYVESNDPEGLKILENFAGLICRCAREWTVENYAPELIEQVHEEVGASNVLIAISGGVDSAVTAELLHRAIGGRLQCLFVDTGLLRKGDPEMVRRVFHDQLGMSLTEVNVAERFLKALRGVTDPTEKRRVMYQEFAAIFAEQFVRAGDVDCMGEGTIYPDLLRGKCRTNAQMIEGCRQIAPLKLLFKEEVRALGRYLGVPEEIITRPSFTSPGLAVRCLGEVTEEKLRLLREADAIFRQEVEAAGLTRRIAQFFVVLTDLKTPGQRGSGYVCVLRALGSSSAGKAPAYKLPYDLMEVVVRRITTELPTINHVVYDITGRPTTTVEWE